MRYVKITLDGIPPSINKFAGRETAWEYRNSKAEWTNLVRLKAKATHLPKPFEKATVQLCYFFPDNRRHDPDNYAGKFLLDGLTKGGVITDDDFKHINLVIAGDVDRAHPRTEITVQECLTMDLKKCPFCGNIPIVYKEAEYYYVACDCGATMLNHAPCMFDTKEDAIKTWNRRTKE